VRGGCGGVVQAAMDEATLVASCLRVKDASTEKLTATQVHATLVAEGAAVDLSMVKKACGKAEKERAKKGPAAPAPEAGEPEAAGVSKAKAKQQKAAAESLKALEAAVVTTQKLVRDKWLENGIGSPPPPEGKALIEFACTRAISGQVVDVEEITMERVAADVAALQWLLTPGCPFVLPDEARSTAQRRLKQLDELRGFRFALEGAKECYLVVAPPAPAVDESEPVGEPVIGSTADASDSCSIDRAMARAGLLDANKVGGGEMDEMD